jgi:NAD(P)-dependent dehydrogenase (short-subunit alcohol dehydrogenase family)
MNDLLTLSGKTVLITGAGGRIGAATAKAVVTLGGSVVLIDFNLDALSSLEKDLASEAVLTLTCDVCDVTQLDTAIGKAKKRFGAIDGAVHSAYPRSAGWGTRFEDLSYEMLSQDLAMQLGGAIMFSQRMIREFAAKKDGSLIHIASIQGVAAPKFEHYQCTEMVSPIEYSAIKSGVISASRYLAKYLKGTGVRVNCVSPGGILDAQPPSFVERYRNSCNQKGLLNAGDVVGAICFLLSDHSRYMTGQNIVVDDGWSL